MSSLTAPEGLRYMPCEIWPKTAAESLIGNQSFAIGAGDAIATRGSEGLGFVREGFGARWSLSYASTEA